MPTAVAKNDAVDAAVTGNVRRRNALRLLFVAFADSIHTARWAAQLTGLGWDLHVFAVTHKPPCPELQGLTLHRLVASPRSRSSVPQRAFYWPLSRGETRLTTLLERTEYYSAASRLARLIEALKPDIVHSLEMQSAGYLTLQARRRMRAPFPAWIYSCWGNDIHYFGRQPQHVSRIREVLSHCDYLFTDCHRDVALAREYGFTGELLGVYPGGGGYELAKAREMWQPGSIASRRVIAIKGYNGGPSVGRGLVAIEAVRRCAAQVSGYEVVVYSAAPEVRAAVANLERDFGMRVSIMPACHHAEILRLMGCSRIAVGLGLSDGSPNTLLESMIMGAFPIQSDTVSTREWITSGDNGLLVPPEDPEEVAIAIRRALGEDELVEHAAKVNARIADERLERDRIRDEVRSLYKRVAMSDIRGDRRRMRVTPA
jgi:glycosyltransferase involved in cell wall biosynthesis